MEGGNLVSSHSMRIFVLIMTLGICGCAHNEGLSEQPEQATLQVQKWVLVGTSLADARQIMEKHHFNCSEMTNSNFGDLKLGDFLYCDYHDSANQGTAVRRWQVALVLGGGKVADVLVITD